MSKALAHLRAQWMGALALLIALGTGSAYAANTVFSEDIVNGQVKAPDLASNSVTGQEIRDREVDSIDLKDDSVVGLTILDGVVSSADLGIGSVRSEEILDHAVGDAEVRENAINQDEVQDGSLTGTELATGSITATDVATNTLTTADIAGADVNGGHVSFSAGAVANGRCEQVDLSVGGAKAGEAVIVSTKGSLQNGVVLYGQRVPSDGHVAADLCNFSGATMSAISSLAVRIITFG